ncbi:MAG: AAA family ATPase [Rubrivivax sp.]
MIDVVAAEPTIQLHLHGPPRLLVDAREHALEGLSALLAARLALEGPQPRADLAAWLWPESEPARARANLRQRLLRLKSQAGVEWIVGDAVLRLAEGLHIGSGDPCGGEFLQGVQPGPAEEAMRWLGQTRATLRHRQAQVLDDRAAAAEAEQRWDDALAARQARLALDPHAESGYGALIRLHYLAGDSGRAQQVHEQLCQMLRQTFGAEPGPQTQALMQVVRQMDGPPATATPVARAPVPSLTLQRPPRLVGREREQQAVRVALETRTALLLLGEAGIGKSRLLADGVPARPDVARVKAQAGDAGVPYATLARLLRGLIGSGCTPGPPAELARLLPELGPVLPLPADGERLLLQGAVEQLVARAALSAVLVDDLHFADEASVEMLTALGGSEVLQGLAWVFTQRPGEGCAAAAALRDRLEEAGRLTSLALSPLGAADMIELVRSLQLPALDAEAIGPRLLQHTGGNPLFALATLQQLLRADAGTSLLPRPESVGALIDRRLRQLSETALALARVAAIAGPAFGPGLAESVLGRRAIELTDAWAELESAQVIRDSAFAHDLVLEATLRSIPQAIGRHLHAAVAAHLMACQGEAARVALHWTQAGEDDKALPWLLQAADDARRSLRRREEAGFVRRAAEILGAAGRAGAQALWLRAAETLELTDGVDAALPMLDRAVSAAEDEPQRARALSRRASAHMKRFQTTEAIRDGREALDAALARRDAAAVAEVLTVLTCALSVEGDQAQAVQLLDQHWPLVEGLTDPQPTPFIERGILLDNVGRHAEARQSFRRGIELALAQQWHSEAVIGILNLATSHLDSGELLKVLDLLDDAERLRASHDGLQGAVVSGSDLRAIALRDLGRPAAALPIFQQQIEQDVAQAPARVPLTRLHRAWLWASIGQWARALQDLRPQTEFVELPAWAWARALQLRARIEAARGGPFRDTVQAAWEALDPGALVVVREGIAIDRALAADASGRAAARRELALLHQRALSIDHHATRWSAAWALATLARADGDRDEAASWARACLARPTEHAALNLLDGSWWHGLWQVWQGLGEAGLAEAARAEGVAWINRVLQRELQPAFHAAFRDAVTAHRELLAAR